MSPRQWIENPLRLLGYIRLIVPFLCLSQAVSDPGQRLAALLIGSMALGDGVFYLAWAAKESPYSCHLLIVRDALYALVFYLSYLKSPDVPALLLAPLPLMEMMAINATKAVVATLMVELALLGFRMWTLSRIGYPLVHPSWPFGVILAMGLASLLGFYIRELKRIRDQAQSVLVSLVEETWRQSGADEPLPPAGSLAALLSGPYQADEIAQECQEFGKQVGEMFLRRLRTAGLLTPRELEVLKHMAHGHSYRAVAHILKISEGTVRAHVAAIMRKANAHTRAEVIAWATAHRLIPPPVSSPSQGADEHG